MILFWPIWLAVDPDATNGAAPSVTLGIDWRTSGAGSEGRGVVLATEAGPPAGAVTAHEEAMATDFACFGGRRRAPPAGDHRRGISDALQLSLRPNPRPDGPQVPTSPNELCVSYPLGVPEPRLWPFYLPAGAICTLLCPDTPSACPVVCRPPFEITTFPPSFLKLFTLPACITVVIIRRPQ